jgi:hypothetical protein
MRAAIRPRTKPLRSRRSDASTTLGKPPATRRDRKRAVRSLPRRPATMHRRQPDGSPLHIKVDMRAMTQSRAAYDALRARRARPGRRANHEPATAGRHEFRSGEGAARSIEEDTESTISRWQRRLHGGRDYTKGRAAVRLGSGHLHPPSWLDRARRTAAACRQASSCPGGTCRMALRSWAGPEIGGDHTDADH